MVEVWWGMTRGKTEMKGADTSSVEGASKREGPPAFTTIRSF